LSPDELAAGLQLLALDRDGSKCAIELRLNTV